MPGDEMILDFIEAAALIAEHAAHLPFPTRSETVEIGQALGRCLAVELLADRHQPPFDRSTRDGYAVRAADLDGGITRLNVIGELRAGQPPFQRIVGHGEAVEIMTGAPMPQGADAVLMVEHADLDPADPLSITTHPGRTLKPGSNVVRAGSEAEVGSVVIPSGIRLSPMHIGAAVSCGASTLEVFVRPRVAILATGDELVEAGEPVLDYQIRNSNSYSLAAQVERAGGIPIRLPIAPDNLVDLQEALSRAMQADIILLSGGVSMGKFDFVEQALATLNAQFLFTGVRMQPGRPVVFGKLPGGAFFFGLPGNPVSTMVTFALFAAPLIRAVGGEQNASPLFSRARIMTGFEHAPGLTRFLPAQFIATWDDAQVTPVPWQGSGDLASVARANCFIVIPPDRRALVPGDEVSVLLAYL